MKNIIVGQSGGPTAAINASLYGVIREGLKSSDQIGRIYGMINGIEGLLDDCYMDLSNQFSNPELELLKLTPAAYLGSCRYKLPASLSDAVFPVIFEKLAALNIGWFLYIGGNDSMDTVSKLSRYAAQIGSDIKFIGIPKTIDNDLVMTDHTPGYGSAAKYVAATVREIVLDASVYRQKAVTIVEIMGRHAGWLTASAALARKYTGDNPLLIYLPESDFDMEAFADDLTRALEQRNNVVVCVSEGISDSSGAFICEASAETRVDSFGHKMLTGSGKVLEQFVRRRFGIKVRSVELNVCQRCSGMAASAVDLEEAAAAGSFGVRAALNGETGRMISFHRVSDRPYSINYTATDVNQVCNLEKPFPKEWINAAGNDISDDYLIYATPLIIGEPSRVMAGGLPVYLCRED